MLEKRKAYINDSTEEEDVIEGHNYNREESIDSEENEGEGVHMEMKNNNNNGDDDEGEAIKEEEKEYIHTKHMNSKAMRPRWLKSKRPRLTCTFAWELAKSLCVLWLVLLILSWNLGNLGFYNFATPHIYRPLALALHLDQSWNMFSPRPPNVDWWYIMQGWMVNGTEVEMHRNEGLWNWEGNTLEDDWGPPSPFYKSFGNHRWFKFFEQMNSNANHPVIRLEFGRYVCREWNRRHDMPSQIYEYKIWWMSVLQLLDGSTKLREKELLWHHVCMDSKPVLPEERQPQQKQQQQKLQQEH